MAVAKQEALDLIGKLPDSATLSDILDALRFKMQIDRGLRDIDEGRVVSHQVVRDRLAAQCAKLDPIEEQALADLGLSTEKTQWPEY